MLALVAAAAILGAAVLWLAFGSEPDLATGARQGRQGSGQRAEPLAEPAADGVAAEPRRTAPAAEAPPADPPPRRSAPPGVALVRVVTSKGSPVPGLPLRVQHDAAGETKGYSIPRERREALAEECGAGALQVDAITDVHGGARFETLARGRYRVRTHGNAWEHGSVYGALLASDEPVVAGGPAATIVLDRPFFTVELAGPDGAPWPGTITSPTRHMDRAPAGWPAGAHVQLVEAVRTGNGWAARDLGRPSHVHGRIVPGATASVAFDVEAGEDYLLTVIGRGAGGLGFDGSPQHLRLEPDEVHRRIRCEAEPLPGFGAVEVAATVRMRSNHLLPPIDFFGNSTGADTGPTRPEPTSLHVDGDTMLQLEHPTSGVILLEPERGSGSAFRFHVPAGAYRIHGRAELARPQAQVGARHGADHVDVVVTARQTAAAGLDVGEGGVVVLDVADGESSVYLELVASSGRRMPLRWSRPDINGGASTNWWWPAGEVTSSQPAPAGHFRLVGHRGFAQDGGKRYDVPITIEDGAEVRVRLD